MFEPGSVSETQNHCRPACVLPKMLQQQSEEGTHFPEWKHVCLKAVKISFNVPLMLLLLFFQFHNFLYMIPCISKVFVCLFLFVFHSRTIRFVLFFSFKKKNAFVFHPILKLAKGSTLVHSRLLRNCSSASPVWRDVPDSGWGHSLAFRKEYVATAAREWFCRENVDFFLRFLAFFAMVCARIFLCNVLCKV